MCTLASEVFKKGHRRIGVISGITKGNDRAAERVRGIKDACAEFDLDAAALNIIETSYGIENGKNAFDALVQDQPRPTAIMCGNDVLAVGALLRAQERGFRVPEDISITGFDDIELARIVSPCLTTIHVPHREMGKRAAIELIAIIEKKSTGTSVELQSPLKLRESLRTAPKD